LKKYTIFIIALLVGISVFTTWRILSNHTKPVDALKSERERSGPKFKNEGTLYFIHPQNSDTVKSILVEVADTPEEINRGLMYRNKMESNEGMLFIFSLERQQTFWMKNTMIPLDIIFINESHRIVHIAKHTIPYSRDPIPSVEPARYVLEVNAGFCDEYKIAEQYEVGFTHDKSLSL